MLLTALQIYIPLCGGGGGIRIRVVVGFRQTEQGSLPYCLAATRAQVDSSLSPSFLLCKVG